VSLAKPDQLRRWHLLFYVFAAFNAATIAWSLILHHQLLDALATSVEVNQSWVLQLEHVDLLEETANAIDMSVNDAYDSRKAAAAEGRFRELRDRMGSLLDGARRAAESVSDASMRNQLLASLAAISDGANGLLGDVPPALADISRGYQARAGREMATEDIDFDRLLNVLRRHRLAIREFRRIQFEEQASRAEGLHRYELWFSGLAAALVLWMLLYGHAIRVRVRRAQTVLEEQRAKMISASKMATLGEMAGGIAHEINNPIAIIQMQANILNEAARSHPPSQAEVKEAAGRIEQTTARIAGIVRGLRSFARDGTNDPLRPVELRKIIDDTLVFCREKFRNRNLPLTVALPPGEITVRCRPSEISQVLLNLISNAAEAVEGQAAPWIRIDVQESAAAVEVAVTDSGPGVAPEHREKIMQPFFTTKEVGKGLGLGLSISKGIMEAHGGSLRYDSSRPRSRFVLRLPKAARTAA
jgi:signal transduction histidine kinase